MGANPTPAADARDPMARRMANWVAALDYDDLPVEVVTTAKRCILDYFGVLVRGSTLPQVQAAYHYVLEMGGRPDSTIAGRGTKTAPAYAAFVNGTFAHSCEFDDAHVLAGHPGVVVIPAALALAEARGLSGRALITAVVAGYEMMVMSGAPIHQRSLHLGWHSTKVQGVFGAAAAAAKLLDLDVDQTTHAFGIAGSEASGVMEYDQSGGEVKRLHAGSASRAGMQSALLARHGLTGPPTIFEGRRGIFHMFSDRFDADPESFWTGRYYMPETMFKMSPAVGTLHGAIDAAREIRSRAAVDPAEIRRVEAYVSELAFTHGASIVRPTDCISAQFSLAYSLGLAFVRGGNRLTDYLDPATWTDPAILAVADKVEPIVRDTAPGASILGAAVKVFLNDGRVLEYDQPLPRGHHRNPPSQAELEAKFRDLTAGVVPQAQASAIVAAVADLETLSDVAGLASLSAAPAS